MVVLRRVLGCVLLATAALAASGCADDTTCEVGGRRIPVGHPFTCMDGCNGCVCQDEDTITSTGALCSQPSSEAAGKLDCFDQVWHHHGETWECSTGGECTCNDGGIKKS